ncbi:unnamed protein product [Lactuca virosa]|uniref:Uncharacterized protein n=1 Tax=Lactuca virosa TaxID=75947 RepID=A0AAU9MRW7_9ASTR|nr:unnamed protein product [Lactuca virosa]
MITRSKLVEQLRDSQIRSQHKWSPLVIFSPKPNLSSWIDVGVAVFWLIVLIILVTSSYMTLYLRHYWLSFIIICLSISIPIRLRISRQTIARKKDRRLLLPLSM